MDAISEGSADVLSLLRRHAASGAETRCDGTTWRRVYLGISRPAGMTGHEFSGHLRRLQLDGDYRQASSPSFGWVRI
jgi:hypothetical protein